MQDASSKALVVPAEAPAPAVVIPVARRRAAWAIAIAADALQWVLAPMFAEGALSIPNGVIDVGVGIALTALIGFHWSFLPAFIAESIPFVDLVPTWTGSVWLATRGRR